MSVQQNITSLLTRYNITHRYQNPGEQEEKGFTCDRVQAHVETLIEKPGSRKGWGLLYPTTTPKGHTWLHLQNIGKLEKTLW